ncbi:synaptotagmin-like protein 2 isoform X3 [Cololabis saira]|uniref:synaptotagmin-like protein 2 isoform X3 n=1 Tax=Cololabis saira TaxID=129043 RepID=UPI002AD2E0AD|nr:synaptotagmin-like protein 2 isoform X3 [Cololabis saira]
MIDLSFLTEEEQETILVVLRRDAELKNAEEQRVQNLQRTVDDRRQLRFLTGEWFYETKQLRHQNRIQGSDIIRASMKHVQKLLTKLELSYILPERSRFGSSENMFDPPELCGLLPEVKAHINDDGYQSHSHDFDETVLRSPMKRRNPFSSELAFEENNTHLVDGKLEQTHVQNDAGCGDRPCPITPNLKPSSSRSLPSSKSLETLTSQTTSTHPKPRSMKASCSVPVLQQDKIDGASSFNINMKQDTGSSKSNMSLSSGMTCTSSLSSISSISLADWGDVGVQGSIQFAVNYIQKLVEFQIFVVLCRGLAVADTKNNRSDPYVKCYLLPDKTKLGKRKTSAKKKTLNPTFNEVLTYKIVLELLKTQSLNISVWHNNTFGRNSFLGEVDLDLSEWDFSNTQINEYALKARVSAEISTSTLSSLEKRGGQMRVALRFLLQMPRSKQRARTETGEVQIWVKDCKNLPPVRGGIISPFVKCAVLPDTSWKSRQKTRVVKRTESPMFNHTMVYDGFRLEDLREACVELTVWDHERLKNHYVGGLRLGLGTGKSYGINVVWMDSTTQEVNLWQRMLQFSGEWVEDVLPLRMLESARSMSS